MITLLLPAKRFLQTRKEYLEHNNESLLYFINQDFRVVVISEVSKQPPRSILTSMTTLPVRMLLTISSVTTIGVRPVSILKHPPQLHRS